MAKGVTLGGDTDPKLAEGHCNRQCTIARSALSTADLIPCLKMIMMIMILKRQRADFRHNLKRVPANLLTFQNN